MNLESGTYALVWGAVEVNVAIICASLLVMKPLWMKWIPGLASQTSRSNSDSRRGSKQETGKSILTRRSVNAEITVGQEPGSPNAGVASVGRDGADEGSESSGESRWMEVATSPSSSATSTNASNV